MNPHERPPANADERDARMNPYAAPLETGAWQAEDEEYHEGTIIRRGDCVILPSGHHLPNRCVICNRRAAVERQVDVVPLGANRWIGPVLLSVLTLGLGIGVIKALPDRNEVAVLVVVCVSAVVANVLNYIRRRRSELDPAARRVFYICRSHQWRQRIQWSATVLLCSWLLLPRFTTWVSTQQSFYTPVLVLLFVASTFLQIRLFAKRLETGHIELRGCGKEFLKSFPYSSRATSHSTNVDELQA